MSQNGVHAHFDGPIVMVGFGSIGKGTLPLLERHIAFDRSKFVVIAPDDTDRNLLDERQIRFLHLALTKDNYREVLAPLITAGPGRAMVVNLSVDTSSVDMMALAKELDAFYIDTVVEPWPGLYTNRALSPSARSNYALRESLLDLRRRKPGGVTAVSCCGANPGMVSWMVKQALLDVAADLDIKLAEPKSREEWARLMRHAGVKGIHIAERDTQRARDPKPRGKFVNTWSVEGFVSEGLQPSELGWGTHEKTLPPGSSTHSFGCEAAIYLLRPGAGTRVRSWTPTARAQHGFLVTHNESISIADYFTLREDGKVVYRPTCHYAYHPCDDAVLSLHELAGKTWHLQSNKRLMMDEIAKGIDELGVLLMGPQKGVYWYGSRLTIEEARRVAPHNNATSLQVTAAVLAGVVWAIEHPRSGLVEPDEMDFARILEIALPYLGEVVGVWGEWTPLADREVLFPEDLDREDPWQFKNIRVV